MGASQDGGCVDLSRWRLAGALVFGHLAAAYAFAAAMLLFAALTDRDAALPRSPGEWQALAHGLAFAPLVAGAVGLWITVLMFPASLITSPLTYFAARALRIEWPAALAGGAAVGVADVCVVLLWFGDIGPSSRPGPAGAPPVVPMFLVCAALAGMAYGAVVWRLCIRPRLDRCGGARWLEV